MNDWVLGARPRTLALSVAPVLVGTAAVKTINWRTLATLVVATGLQVGVNYANDYFDGVKGVDTAQRQGPMRLVASGRKPARAVRSAAIACFAVAAAAGLAVAASTSWKLLFVGGAGILAALGYTGGRRPYASWGIAEVMVFAFFGPIATVGTAFAVAGSIPAHTWWMSVPLGALAASVLVINNLRDIPTDRSAGRRTLAVRIGDHKTRLLYAVLMIFALFVPTFAVINGAIPYTCSGFLLSLLLVVPALRESAHGSGIALVRPLVRTVQATGVVAVALAAGIWVAL